MYFEQHFFSRWGLHRVANNSTERDWWFHRFTGKGLPFKEYGRIICGNDKEKKSVSRQRTMFAAMYTFFEGDDFMACLAAEEIDVLKRLQNERMLFPFNEIEPNVEQLKCSSSTKTFVIGIVRVEAKVRQKNCYVVLAEIDPHSKSSSRKKRTKSFIWKTEKKFTRKDSSRVEVSLLPKYLIP